MNSSSGATCNNYRVGLPIKSWIQALGRRHWVSVVIPVKNRPKLLLAAAASVLAQSYRPIELLVVDDGSNDETPELFAQWASAHWRDACFEPQLIRSAGIGAPAARNTGLVLSKGEFIKFLDSDDLLDPAALESQVFWLDQMPEIDFVWAPYTMFTGASPGGGSNAALNAIGYHSKEATRPPIESDCLLAPHAPVAATFRRSLLARVGPWLERLRRWQDLEYHARIMAQRPLFCRLAVPLYFYRQHVDGQISAANKTGHNIEGARESLAAVEAVFSAAGIKTEASDKMLRDFYLLLSFHAASQDNRTLAGCLLRAADRYSSGGGFRFKTMFFSAAFYVLGARRAEKIANRYLNMKSKLVRSGS